MNDLELQDISGDISNIPLIEENKIVSINISLEHIKENGSLYLNGTITGVGLPRYVIVNSIDIYVNGSLSYTNNTRLEGLGTILLSNIGISDANYNANHTSISVYIIAHGYNDVTSNIVTKKLPTTNDLSKEFINNEGLDEDKNVYRLKICPAENNNSNNFLNEGSIYFTIDSSDPSDASNSNRQIYKNDIGIEIPNVGGNYIIKAYHVVGNINAKLDDYSFTIDSEMYNVPTITYDNDAVLIKFSDFPTNVSDDIILLLQYEILDYSFNYLIDNGKINIGTDTFKEITPTENGRVRARIVDSRGEEYGKSSWSAMTSFIISKKIYNTPIATVNIDNKTVTISNILEETYLILNLHYNDDTEVTKNDIVGDENNSYSFEYNKSGKATYKLVNKHGSNIGESDYGSVKFAINDELVPDKLYSIPKLSISNTGCVKIDYNLYGDVCDLYYELSLDNNNDGIYEDVDVYKKDSITTSDTIGESSIYINIGEQKGKIKARLINHEGEEKGFSYWSEYLMFDFISEQIIISYPILDITRNNSQITCVFHRQNTEKIQYDKIYYTIDGSKPDKTSNLAHIDIPFTIDFTNNFTIKYRGFYNNNDGEYWSDAKSKYIKYDSSDKYEKPELNDEVVKNYIDIICSINPEDTKSLESIQYVLDEIKAAFGTINLAEQLLSKLDNGSRFSGDSLVLYSDETYSGELNINDDGDTNKLNNYKLPTFQKGHWEFNYFRNEIAKEFTKDELQKVYTNIPITKADGTTELITIKVEDLINSVSTAKNNTNVFRSDNRSLIYGKYIVARFIFNNDKRVKLQNVTFITNNY